MSQFKTCDYCNSDTDTQTAHFKHAKRYACLCRSCWNNAVRWESEQMPARQRGPYLKLATWNEDQR